jgi:very-short-patch-repair endonuclease
MNPNNPPIVPPTQRRQGVAIAAERRLWHTLRDRRFRGLPFTRQVPVDGVGVVDFLCELPGGRRVAVELDGQHDLKPASARIPLGALSARGYLELRFTPPDVLRHLRWVLRDVAEACERSAQNPRSTGGPRAILSEAPPARPDAAPPRARVLRRRRA